MPDFQSLQLDFDPRGFATLWLSRAETRNVFDRRMIDELIGVLDALKERSGLRFLILRGRGGDFCAGIDPAWMQRSAAQGYDACLGEARALAELLYNLYRFPLPTLAVVQGAAFGSGLGLVACCDLAIGARDAQFCLPEVRDGSLPALIAPFVVQAIGERRARRYALSAECFDGERACELGLLAECYPAEALDGVLRVWIDGLLRNAPQAMQATKELFREVGDGTLNSALRRYSEAAVARAQVSAEGQEGLRALLEKHLPNWQSLG